MANLTSKIFNDTELRGKEKLLVMLLKEKSDLVVGKSISLEMITLCCVSFESLPCVMSLFKLFHRWSVKLQTISSFRFSFSLKIPTVKSHRHEFIAQKKFFIQKTSVLLSMSSFMNFAEAFGFLSFSLLVMSTEKIPKCSV
jgi:hypothetical protein